MADSNPSQDEIDASRGVFAGFIPWRPMQPAALEHQRQPAEPDQRLAIAPQVKAERGHAFRAETRHTVGGARHRDSMEHRPPAPDAKQQF